MTTFIGDKWKISKGAMTIAMGTKNGSFYMTTNRYGSAIMVEGREDLNLWHHRFGHISS